MTDTKQCECPCEPAGANATTITTTEMPPKNSTTVLTHRYVAYYAAWSTYGKNFQVSSIPFDRISHLNYAFGNISSEGELVLGDPYADIDKAFPGDSWDNTKQPFRGNFWQLQKALQQNPYVKLLLSVGGWSWSGRFSDVALTPQSREKFAISCSKFLQTYPFFHGIDIDWEYPVDGGLDSNVRRPEDGVNYTLLLEAIRKELNKLPGPRRLLTIAAPAATNKLKHLEHGKLAKILDFINIMAYDYRGGWSKLTGHHAALYENPNDPENDLKNSVDAVSMMIEGGMPPKKIVLGAAFYGRGWANVPATNNGMYQTYQGLPTGTIEQGVFDYWDIKKRLAEGQLKRYFDNVAKATWAYGNGTMISYDDPESLKAKCDYIKSQGLGGIMIWELSGDDAQYELSNTIVQNLSETVTERSQKKKDKKGFWSKIFGKKDDNK